MFAFGIDDVNKAQNDINMINKATGDAAQQMKITIETQVYASEYLNVASGNTLDAETINRANVLDTIVDHEVRLDEQNIPTEGRFMILPPWACGFIKKSELKDASLSGDDPSLLRQRAMYGYVGSISGFALYKSNNLNGDGTSGTPTNIIAGTKDFVCFASQFVRTETGRRQDTFGDYVRGLKVYGFKATKPEAGTTQAWTKGT